MSVAGVTHTPQARPPGAVPGAPGCAPDPPGCAPRPARRLARGRRRSRPLPGNRSSRHNFFSTSAAGGRGGESRSAAPSLSRCPTPVPAAPARSPSLPAGRRSRVPAPAAAKPLQGLRRHPRGDPAAPPPGGAALPPEARGVRLPLTARLDVPSAQPAQRGFPLRLLAAAPSGPAGAREGGGGRGGGGRRGRGRGRGSSGRGGGAGERERRPGPPPGARREETERRGQSKKEAAGPPRPGPGPAPLPSHHRRPVPLSGGRPGGGVGPGLPGRAGAGAGGQSRPGLRRGVSCGAWEGVGGKGIPDGGAGTWSRTGPAPLRPAALPELSLRSPARVPRAREEPLGLWSESAASGACRG